MSPEPTSEGLHRYPHTQGYHSDLSAADTQPDRDQPRTCTASCAPRCSGACGCPACSLAFTIFCDEAGLLGMEPMSPEQEAVAIARYQDI
jgi:hypothetical protein